MNKSLLTILVIGLAIETGAIFLLAGSREANISSQINSSQINPADSEITVFLAGDIMLGRGVEYIIEQYGAGDFKFPFLKIAHKLNQADILFGNLEGPVSNRGANVGSIYSFRFSPKAVQGLKYAGFDILSLANNHMLDYTRIALEDTMNILKENGINYVGAGFSEQEAFSMKIIEKKGTKVGFLAYTNLGPEVWQAREENPGLAWINENKIEKIKNDIAAAKQAADVLIVSLHTGTEYSKTPTPFQVSFSKTAIDSGADLVVGHHPHVIQPVERYKNGWIAYSLGNFVFDQGFSKETMEGLLLKVVIKNKKIRQVIPQKIKINNHFQPEFFN